MAHRRRRPPACARPSSRPRDLCTRALRPCACAQDGSGSLDRNEVRTLVEMVGTSFTEKELDAAMAELDPSGDGQVDFAEFKQYWVR